MPWITLLAKDEIPLSENRDVCDHGVWPPSNSV